jgi:putative inorganic carbon (HCO3(-)) transporter
MSAPSVPIVVLNMTPLLRTSPTEETTSPPLGSLARFVVAISLAAIAVLGVLALTGLVPPALAIAPAALLSGTAIVVLAVVKFEAFILILIVIRSSLDLAKSSATGSSLTEPASLLALLMMGASIGWLIAQGPVRPHRRLSPLGVSLVLFTLAVGVSVIGSAQIGVSAAAFLKIVSGILMFFVVDRLLTEGMPLRRLIIALFASTIVPVLLPIVGRFTGHDFSRVKDGVESLASTFVLSNNFAHFLVPFLIIGFALLGSIPWRRGRLVMAVFLIIGLVELVYTNTRGAWVALVAGIAIVGFVQSKALLLGIVASTVLIIALVPTVNQRLANLNLNPDRPRTETSWTWRIDHWGAIIPLAAANPVTGIGIGMTAEVTQDHKEPHSDYVRAYVEMGLFGLGAYLLATAAFIGVAHRARTRARGAIETALALGIFAYSIAFAVSSVADNLITGVGWLWYAMPLAAIANWMTYRSEIPATAGASTPPLSPPPQALPGTFV